MKALLLMLLMASQAGAITMKTYTIKNGAHYSDQSGFATTSGSSFTYTFSFDQSAVYATKATSNQGDINKLAGFSDCNSLHQTNSARLGWRWFNNELQIFAYNYAGKVRNQKKLGVALIGTTYSATVSVVGNQYQFIFNGGKPVLLPRGCSSAIATGYKLYPYFGGDETAPHEIKIQLSY